MLFVAINATHAAEMLEVKALHFAADEKSGVVELTENVEIKKGKDELYAQKVIINIDANRTPINYQAFGGVRFVVTTKDARVLHGKADEVFYDAKSGEYRLIGNGEVIEKGKVNAVVGDEIIVNNDIGYVNITGSIEKPAKIIFQLEESDGK